MAKSNAPKSSDAPLIKLLTPSGMTKAGSGSTKKNMAVKGSRKGTMAGPMTGCPMGTVVKSTKSGK